MPTATTRTQPVSTPHALPGRATPTVLVVYESAWGNTRLVAEAVGEGLGASTTVVPVASAPPVDDVHVDLLVIGAPTHAFGLSRPGTREDAHQHGGAELSTGVREWLDAGTAGTRHPGLAATFDTHVRHPNLPGTASRVAARKLRQLGYVLAAGPEIFWVGGTEGPLLEGEVERARVWGAALARRI